VLPRRSLVLGLVLAAALALASVALAANIQIRIEGKTKTIFGATEPRAVATNPLQALDAASLAGEFYFHVATTSFGPYVDQIGRYPAAGAAGWVFKVNGAMPPIAADQVQLKNGDRVLWYYAEFGPSGGGPATLHIKRGVDRCYQVVTQDDNGRERPASGATIVVGTKRYKPPFGRLCLRKAHPAVHATMPGAIRSNVVA
jgi:hypothetical protein